DVARTPVEPAELHELEDGLFAEPLDVERPAAGEVPQPLELLRLADEATGAADVDLAPLGHRLAAADRAVIGEHVRLARLLAGQIVDHLGDHVASALEDDPVAYPEAEPADFVAVVQRDVGHRDSADKDRPQPADRRQLAGAANLDIDRLEHRLGALGRKLVREAPARRLGDKAQALLPVEPVDLVDHAVDLVRQRPTPGGNTAVVLEHFLDRTAKL